MGLLISPFQEPWVISHVGHFCARCFLCEVSRGSGCRQRALETSELWCLPFSHLLCAFLVLGEKFSKWSRENEVLLLILHKERQLEIELWVYKGLSKSSECLECMWILQRCPEEGKFALRLGKKVFVYLAPRPHSNLGLYLLTQTWKCLKPFRTLV